MATRMDMLRALQQVVDSIDGLKNAVIEPSEEMTVDSRAYLGGQVRAIVAIQASLLEAIRELE